MEASISFKSVSKKINETTLLADLSFGIEKGTRFALLGSNDSGKSTILKLISGLVCKDKGAIYVKGIDININKLDSKAIIGYMPQNIDLNQNLTLFENISIYGQLYGFESKIVKENAYNICSNLKIGKYLNSFPGKLSKKVLRIALFARAIIHDPEILLLDEPTMNIDETSKELIWDYLQKFCKSKTILYATKDYAEAKRYSDRIAIIHKGEIKFLGTYEFLFKNTNILGKYLIKCRYKINEDLIKSISLNPKIVNPKIIENTIEFYSYDKDEFFKVLNSLMALEIVNIKSNNSL